MLARLKGQGGLHFVVTATTRPQRAGEVDGVDYRFISRGRFDEMVQGGEFLEWAQVYGNWYGVPRRDVEQALTEGRDVIIKADVQGAATIQRAAPGALLIFLAPPSMEELTERLTQRKTESTTDLATRIETAREEMGRIAMFDYVVINEQDRIDVAVAQICAIVTAEKCRVRPRAVELQ